MPKQTADEGFVNEQALQWERGNVFPNERKRSRKKEVISGVPLIIDMETIMDIDCVYEPGGSIHIQRGRRNQTSRSVTRCKLPDRVYIGSAIRGSTAYVFLLNMSMWSRCAEESERVEGVKS